MAEEAEAIYKTYSELRLRPSTETDQGHCIDGWTLNPPQTENLALISNSDQLG